MTNYGLNFASKIRSSDFLDFFVTTEEFFNELKHIKENQGVPKRGWVCERLMAFTGKSRLELCTALNKPVDTKTKKWINKVIKKDFSSLLFLQKMHFLSGYIDLSTLGRFIEVVDIPPVKIDSNEIRKKYNEIYKANENKGIDDYDTWVRSRVVEHFINNTDRKKVTTNEVFDLVKNAIDGYPMSPIVSGNEIIGFSTNPSATREIVATKFQKANKVAQNEPAVVNAVSNLREVFMYNFSPNLADRESCRNFLQKYVTTEEFFEEIKQLKEYEGIPKRSWVFEPIMGFTGKFGLELCIALNEPVDAGIESWIQQIKKRNDPDFLPKTKRNFLEGLSELSWLGRMVEVLKIPPVKIDSNEIRKKYNEFHRQYANQNIDDFDIFVRSRTAEYFINSTKRSEISMDEIFDMVNKAIYGIAVPHIPVAEEVLSKSDKQPAAVPVPDTNHGAPTSSAVPLKIKFPDDYSGSKTPLGDFTGEKRKPKENLDSPINWIINWIRNNYSTKAFFEELSKYKKGDFSNTNPIFGGTICGLAGLKTEEELQRALNQKSERQLNATVEISVLDRCYDDFLKAPPAERIAYLGAIGTIIDSREALSAEERNPRIVINSRTDIPATTGRTIRTRRQPPETNQGSRPERQKKGPPQVPR